MYLSQIEFLQQLTDGLAIVGTHIQNEAFHVGLHISSEDENKIIHFIAPNNIPFANGDDPYFGNYLFNRISKGYDIDTLPTLSAMCDLISKNALNSFKFKKEFVMYAGGKFKISTGKYIVQRERENYINCAVFIIGILKTFDLHLLDWDSFPNLSVNNTNLLQDWLNSNNIPPNDHVFYHKMTKEVRGSHVFVAPSVDQLPASADQIKPLSDALLSSFGYPAAPVNIAIP